MSSQNAPRIQLHEHHEIMSVGLLYATIYHVYKEKIKIFEKYSPVHVDGVKGRLLITLKLI